MTDPHTQLLQIIDGTTPSANAVDELIGLADRYPYFVAPSAMLLKYYSVSLTDGQKSRAATEVALASPDPATLYRIADRRAAEFENFYPPAETTREITTDDAISTFLKNYGNDSPEENELLERLIFNPVPDYASVLSAKETEKNKSENTDETALRIDAFIRSHADNGTHDETVENETATPHHGQHTSTDPKSLLSESLAKIYIKQRRYDKAFEIITQLSLNYPEKSCYFADQLRFLRKLIINQTSTTKSL